MNEINWRTESSAEVIRPHAYVKGDKLEIKQVTFLPANHKAAGTLNIHGIITDETIGAGGIKLGEIKKDGVNVPKGDYTLTLENLTSDLTFTEPTYYNRLRISWEYSWDGGVNWSKAGNSNTIVYVLFKAPSESLRTDKHFLPTMAAVGSRAAVAWKAAKGAAPSTEKEMFEAIWGQFESRNILRAQDGKQLTYYGSWNVKTVIGRTTDARLDLVRRADGQCTDWAVFMLATLSAQGLDIGGTGLNAKYNAIQSNVAAEQSGRGGFLVGPDSWSFSVAGATAKNTHKATTIPGIPPFGKAGGTAFKYLWKKGAEFTYTAPLAAQGNNNPPGLFPDHAIILVNGQIYDPSYGKTYTNLQDFQDKAVAGFFRVDNNGRGTETTATKNAAGDTLKLKFYLRE